jgi:hypothetical protein
MYQKYINELSGKTFIIRLSDLAHIPSDESNTDYKDYLLWINDGNDVEIIDA